MRLLRTQSEQSVYILSVTNKKKYNWIEQNEKKLHKYKHKHQSTHKKR